MTKRNTLNQEAIPTFEKTDKSGPVVFNHIPAEISDLNFSCTRQFYNSNYSTIQIQKPGILKNNKLSSDSTPEDVFMVFMNS